MLDRLLDGFRQRQRVALSRLLSLLARGEHSADILGRVGRPAKPARVAAVTGSAGVGKSSLIGRLVEEIRRDGQTVAVLACDPQSPLSGGALLGDRFRMATRPEDDGVLIRSLAAVGGHGAIAEHLPEMSRLLEVYGFDVVLIETVGSGQGDTTVQELADVVVLLLQPETGDDLQWEKAGVLEVADVIVIHKADLPGAQNLESQVSAMLALGSRTPAPVIRVSARSGEGIHSLWERIRALPLHRCAGGGEVELLRLAKEHIAREYRRARKEGNEMVSALVREWERGDLTSDQAVRELLELLRKPD